MQRVKEFSMRSGVFETAYSKVVIVKIFGCPIFQGRPQYTQIKTINIYSNIYFSNRNNQNRKKNGCQ